MLHLSASYWLSSDVSPVVITLIYTLKSCTVSYYSGYAFEGKYSTVFLLFSIKWYTCTYVLIIAGRTKVGSLLNIVWIRLMSHHSYAKIIYLNHTLT
jgi:hypothetical protein